MRFGFNKLWSLSIVFIGAGFLNAMEWSPNQVEESQEVKGEKPAHSTAELSAIQKKLANNEQTKQLGMLILSTYDSDVDEDELIKKIEDLLKQGADINSVCCSSCKDTFLQTLIRAGASIRVIDFLIEHGALINTRNCETALTIAVRAKKLDICLRLLAHGAVAEISFKFLNKLLMEIMNNKNTAINMQLLRLLAVYGFTQEISFAADWQEILEKLVPNELLRAIVLNDEQRVARILNHYAQSNALTRTWYNKIVPLWAGSVSPERANVEDEQGVSALWYAVAQGNVAIVKLLLENGANPIVADNAPLRLINRRLAAGGLTQEQRTAYEDIRKLLIRYIEGMAMTFNRINLPTDLLTLIALELGMSRLYLKPK